MFITIVRELDSASFVSASGSKMDQPGHFPPQIHIESHSNAKSLPCILFESLFTGCFFCFGP